jgi:hypothetical protein
MSSEGGPADRSESGKPAAPEPDDGGQPTVAHRLKERMLTWPGLVIGGIATAFIAGLGGWLFGWFRSTAEEAFAGPPLSVRVVPPGEFTSGHTFAPYYVVPSDRFSSPAALAPADAQSLADDPSWALDHGGMAASPEIVRLELRARTDEPVIVNPVRIDVVRTAAPVSGWFVASPACGVEPVRVASVDLDASPPAATYINERGRETGTLAVSVDRQDPELLELQVHSTRGEVDWTAEIPYSGADGTGSVEVDDDGEPFQVTTERGSAGYRPLFGGSGEVEFQRKRAWDRGIVAC